MTFKSLLCACLLTLSLCAGAQTTVSIAPGAPSKEDVKKLFDVMASREQMDKMMRQVFAQMQSLNREEMKKRRPDITEAELARLDRQSEDVIKNFPLERNAERHGPGLSAALHEVRYRRARDILFFASRDKNFSTKCPR